MSEASRRVGVVIPTLGLRPDFLCQCLASVRTHSDAHICIVLPDKSDLVQSVVRECDSLVIDPGRGLASAINAGVRSLPPEIRYVNWLGDDDLLLGEGHEPLVSLLESESNAVLAFGHCRYVNAKSETIFQVRSGWWASWLLRCGPQMLSQPAMLIRRDAFNNVGGLDETLGWAFDLDLLLKLHRVGKLAPVSRLIAGYRWHRDALTVRSRGDSVREASKVRRRYLPAPLRPVSVLWEVPIRLMIRLAGHMVVLSERRLSEGA